MQIYNINTMFYVSFSSYVGVLKYYIIRWVISKSLISNLWDNFPHWKGFFPLLSSLILQKLLENDSYYQIKSPGHSQSSFPNQGHKVKKCFLVVPSLQAEQGIGTRV